MKRTLTKKDIAFIEKESVFSVKDTGEGYEFSWYTDAGEDFSFYIEKGEKLISHIITYCFNFDPEEHAMMWVGQRGAPGLFDLCEDAKKIMENLATLSLVVNNL